MTVLLAIDHGNGNVKACSRDKMILLPSVYARQEEFIEDSFFSPVSFDLYEFSSDKYPNEIYYWGRDVVKANRLIATYGVEGRYVSKPFQLLSECTMGLLLPDGQSYYDDVVVVTGIPTSSIGTNLEKEIVEVFRGRHAVKINGETKAYHVQEVYVLPQPLGTVFHMYLDHEGRVANPDYESNYVGVIDIGNGTTDIDGVKALKRQFDDFLTIPAGMFDAYKKIANYINRVNPNADATPQSVERQLIRPEIDANTYKISNRIPPVDISQIKEKAFRELAEELINKISQTWPNRSKFDTILLTGGGAQPLARYFKEWQPDIYIVEKGQQSNVSGFYKYGLFRQNALQGV